MALPTVPGVVQFNQNANSYGFPMLETDGWTCRVFPTLPNGVNRNSDIIDQEYPENLTLTATIFMSLIKDSYNTPRLCRRSTKYYDDHGRQELAFTAGLTINRLNVNFDDFRDIVRDVFASPTIDIKPFLSQHRQCDIELLIRIFTHIYEARNLISAVFYMIDLQVRHEQRVRQFEERDFRRQLGISRVEALDIATIREPLTRYLNLTRIKAFYEYNVDQVADQQIRVVVNSVLGSMFASRRLTPIIQILKANAQVNQTDPLQLVSLDEEIQASIPANNRFRLEDIAREVKLQLRTLLWLKSSMFSFAINSPSPLDIEATIQRADDNNQVAMDREKARHNEVIRLGALDYSYYLALESENGHLTKIHVQSTERTLKRHSKQFLKERIFGHISNQQAVLIIQDLFVDVPNRQNLYSEAENYWKMREVLRARQIHLSKIMVGTTCFTRYSFLRPGHAWFKLGRLPANPRTEALLWTNLPTSFLNVLYSTDDQNGGFASVKIRPMTVEGQELEDEELTTQDFANVFNHFFDYPTDQRQAAFENDESPQAIVLRRVTTAHRGNFLYAGEGQENVLDRKMHTSLVAISIAMGIQGATEKVKSIRIALANRLARMEAGQNNNPTLADLMRNIARSYLMPLPAFIRTFSNISPAVRDIPYHDIFIEFSNVANNQANALWHLKFLRQICLVALNVLPLDWKRLAENAFSRPVLEHVIGVDNNKLRQIPLQLITLPPATSLEDASQQAFGVNNFYIQTPLTIWPNPGIDLVQTLNSYLPLPIQLKQPIINLMENTGKRFIREATTPNAALYARVQFQMPFQPNAVSYNQAAANPVYKSYFIHTSVAVPWAKIDRAFREGKTTFQNGLILALGRGNLTLEIFAMLTNVIAHEFCLSIQAVRAGERTAICSPNDLNGVDAAFKAKHVIDYWDACFYMNNDTNGEVPNMDEDQNIEDYASELSKKEIVEKWLSSAEQMIYGIGRENCTQAIRNILADRMGDRIRFITLIVTPFERKTALSRVAENWVTGAWPDYSSIVEGHKFVWPEIDQQMFHVVTRCRFTIITLRLRDWQVDGEGAENPAPGTNYLYFEKRTQMHKYLEMDLSQNDAITPEHVSRIGSVYPSHDEIMNNLQEARQFTRFDIACSAFNHLMDDAKIASRTEMRRALNLAPRLQQIAIPAQPRAQNLQQPAIGRQAPGQAIPIRPQLPAPQPAQLNARPQLQRQVRNPAPPRQALRNPAPVRPNVPAQNQNQRNNANARR